MNQIEEEWTHINGYEGLYIVSNLGRVKSFHKGYWKLLKPQKHKEGYLIVNLYKNGKMTSCSIHRLVSLNFIPNPENKPEVNHIDENKENNAVSNLEWVSSKENKNHGTRNERASKILKEKYKNGDYRRKRNKKVSCYDLESGDFIQEYESIKQAYDVLKKPDNYGDISRCCKGRVKSSCGYYWSYDKKNNFFDE